MPAGRFIASLKAKVAIGAEPLQLEVDGGNGCPFSGTPVLRLWN